MTSKEVLDKFDKIRAHKHKGKPSPHKALLIIYALEKTLDGSDWILFEDAEKTLQKQLTEHGHGTKPRPEYPFVRLANDGIWEITALEILNPAQDYSASKLKQLKAKGRISPEIAEALKADSELANGIMFMLRKNFRLF